MGWVLQVFLAFGFLDGLLPMECYGGIKVQTLLLADVELCVELF
jgi:hypothetical protein